MTTTTHAGLPPRIPRPGFVTIVPEIPPCNFCQDGTPGPIDFRTYLGPWANGCIDHWITKRATPEFGVGNAQLWITEDQREGAR